MDECFVNLGGLQDDVVQIQMGKMASCPSPEVSSEVYVEWAMLGEVVYVFSLSTVWAFIGVGLVT